MCAWVVIVADRQTSIILMTFSTLYILPLWNIEKWNFQKKLEKYEIIKF